MQTVIHSYSFNTDNPEQAKQYQELSEKLRAQGLKCFETWGGNSHYMPQVDGKTIELETAFLFSNQWNTAPIEGVSKSGLRVFDWAQDYTENRRMKMGHWIEQTEEMRAIRRDTLVCGYCGKNYPPGSEHGAFCSACLDSEYLKESELHLLRLLPVALHLPKREPLTEQEKATLLPLYVQRQTTGADSRAVRRKKKTREQVEEKFRRETGAAVTEYKGMTWLLDHEVNTENCIYYSHTDKFSFGWRSPVSEAVKSALLDMLSEFPFAYEIKAESGKTETVLGR